MHGYTDAQAKLINYGLLVPRYTSFNNMALDIQAGTWTRATNYDSTKTPWQNLGLGANDWSRVLDFDGYLHTAKQIMAALAMDAASYAAYDIPSFVTRSESSVAENIAPKDIRLIDNGSITMENLYYGLYYHNSLGSFYKVIGRCNSLGTGSITISDTGFRFSRTGGTDGIIACMFLCDTNINNGQAGEGTSVPAGNFIPITPSRALITPYFDTPHCNISYDRTNLWFTIGGGDAVFVIKSEPDGDYMWDCNLTAEYISGGVTHNVLTTPDVQIWLARYYDSAQQVYKPNYIRMQTDRANAELVIKVYATDPSVDFVDVFYREQSLGSPVFTTSVEIASGEILSSAQAVENMTRAIFAAASTEDPSYSEECDIHY